MYVCMYKYIYININLYFNKFINSNIRYKTKTTKTNLPDS